MTTALNGLDEYIEARLDDWYMPGAAVAVVHRDEVVYARGHGVLRTGGDEPVDEHTLFQIGSTTKAFTATAVGLLVDRGLMHWDDPVVDHLGEFQLSDPWLTRQISVRDLLAHRTGFRDFWSPGLEVMSTDEALRRMRYSRTFDPFRASFNYSNVMYAAAGKVVEAVSGMTWPDFIRNNLFAPLGMSRSGTSAYDYWDERFVAPSIFGTAAVPDAGTSDARDPNVAIPHVAGDGSVRAIPWQSYDTLAAAGALVSTASELAQWIRFNLGRGTIGSRGLVSAQIVDAVHGPQNLAYESKFPFQTGPSVGAMGWFRETHRGHTHVSHGGLMLGSPAYLSMLPDKQIGVVVLANCQTPNYQSYVRGEDPAAFHKCVSLWIFDRLLGLPDGGLRDEFKKRMSAIASDDRSAEEALRAERLPDTSPSVPMDAYAGIYHDVDSLFGPTEVRRDDEGLILSFAGAGAYSAVLEHWHHDVFRLRSSGAGYRDPFATFTVGPRGHIESMTVFESEFRRLEASSTPS